MTGESITYVVDFHRSFDVVISSSQFLHRDCTSRRHLRGQPIARQGGEEIALPGPVTAAVAMAVQATPAHVPGHPDHPPVFSPSQAAIDASYLVAELFQLPILGSDVGWARRR